MASSCGFPLAGVSDVQHVTVDFTQEEWHQLEPAQKGHDAEEPPEPGLAG